MSTDYDVFISYRKDDPTNGVEGAERLARNLETRLRQDWHFKVFLDKSGIEGGADWQTTIDQALDSAHSIIVLFNRNCFAVRRNPDVFIQEIRTSLERKRKVIPVFIKGFDHRALPAGIQFPTQGFAWDDTAELVDPLADMIGRAIGANQELLDEQLWQVRRMTDRFLSDDGQITIHENKDIIRIVDRFNLPPEEVDRAIAEQTKLYLARSAPSPSLAPGSGGRSSEVTRTDNRATQARLVADPQPLPVETPTEIGFAEIDRRTPLRLAGAAAEYVDGVPPAAGALMRRLLKVMRPQALDEVLAVKASNSKRYTCIYTSTPWEVAGGYKVFLGHQPDGVYLAFDATTSDGVMGEPGAHWNRLQAAGAVCQPRHAELGDKLTALLPPDCPAELIAKLGEYARWFLLVAPVLDGAGRGAEVTPGVGKVMEDHPAWAVPVLRLLVRELPSTLTVKAVPKSRDYVKLEYPLDTGWVVWFSPEAEGLHVTFAANPDETVGAGPETYLEALGRLSGGAIAPFKEDGERYLGLLVPPDPPQALVEAVQKALNWFLLESPAA